MTEAFIKKANHILNQATSKDNLREYEIAHKLYCNGLEYFETAINYETNPIIKHRMTAAVKEYELRIDHLTRCFEYNQADIIPIQEWDNGSIVRMTSISMSEAQCINQDVMEHATLSISNDEESECSLYESKGSTIVTEKDEEESTSHNIATHSFSCCFGFF